MVSNQNILMDKNRHKHSGQPILGQLLSFIPVELFRETVLNIDTQGVCLKLKVWDHFVFMFYGILTGSPSLRGIIKQFELFGEKLKHCGLSSIPARSSISDANKLRPSSVFMELYLSLYLHFKSYLSDSYLRMKINGEIDPKSVEIFDSTTIGLFVDVFKNTGRLPLNGKRKGGIKAFTKITLAERVPNYIHLKSATTNEKVFLGKLKLSPGTIAVFDKGFQKFKQYKEWSEQGIFYVTLLNKNAKFKIVAQRKLEESLEVGVQMDADIELSYYCPKVKQKINVLARMVTYIDPVKGSKLVFVSNLMNLKAFTICLLYKNRWTIEPLFKQIKQNFELNHFLADSPEGIKTQITICMILNLIFTVIHKKIKESEDFSTMVSLAAKNTGSYVSFVDFFLNPKPNLIENCPNIEIVQLTLFPNQQGGTFLNSS